MKNNTQDSPLTETALLVLLAMYKPNHGYGVMQFVQEKTNGRVIFGPGTLYGAINNLAKKKWISQCKDVDSSRKKVYLITNLGKKQVEQEMDRMNEVYKIGLEIMKEES